MTDPTDVYTAIYRDLTTTRCIPVWRGPHLIAVDPLTHEEASVLAQVLTATFITLSSPDQPTDRRTA